MINRQSVRWIGVILILISVAPTVIGMISAFNRSSEERNSDHLSDAMHLAMSPVFIVTGILGIGLVIASFGMKRTGKNIE